MLSWVLQKRFLLVACCAALLLSASPGTAQGDRSSASKSDSADASNPPPLDYEKFLEKLRTQLESSPYLQADDIEIDGVKLSWNFGRKPCSIPLMQGDAKAETKGRVVEPKEPERFTGRLADAPAPPCK
jgi:hypothetical protein